MNKVDRYIIESFEQSFSKAPHKALQRLWLPQGATLPSSKLRYTSSLRGVPTVFGFSALLAWFGIKIYFMHMAYTSLTRHQIQKHFRALVHIIFLSDLPLEFLFICAIALMPMIVWACYVYYGVSAWNRRADRLKREPTMPEPVPAETPGVWPPPPRTMP